MGASGTGVSMLVLGGVCVLSERSYIYKNSVKPVDKLGVTIYGTCWMRGR